MPRATNGTWVEFGAYGDNGANTIERPFSTEVAALRSAVENGNKVVFVEFGETLAEALARQAAQTPPKADAPARKIKVRSAEEIFGEKAAKS